MSLKPDVCHLVLIFIWPHVKQRPYHLSIPHFTFPPNYRHTRERAKILAFSQSETDLKQKINEKSMVLDQLKSSFKKWRGSTSREQRIIPEEISLKGTSASLSADEGTILILYYKLLVIIYRLYITKFVADINLASVEVFSISWFCQ